MANTVVTDDDQMEHSGIDMFMIQQDGETFKATVLFKPYFYVAVRPQWRREVVTGLERQFEGILHSVETVYREDLDAPNHIAGRPAEFLKLSFRSVRELMDVRAQVLPAVRRAAADRERDEAMFAADQDDAEMPRDILMAISDIREYDVPYITRVAIDTDIRVGAWYNVTAGGGIRGNALERLPNMVVKAEPRVLAFDIECTKAELKFPNPAHDVVYMISYMYNGQGYLLINREIVTQDVPDFEYTPKPQFEGPFIVENLADERTMLARFFEHCRELRPNIFVTYNGDFFDWPFIERRAEEHNIDMFQEIGVRANRAGVYSGRHCSHMDCYYWVKRDSYLPQGAHGLKAVTKHKLRYNPVEIDPEEMLTMAAKEPLHMASYSVSDAVATYYLYDKYVHNFIFSLATIIPLPADDVLRKGSGTLCEMLLMVQAVKNRVICPNKQTQSRHVTHKGHLLETETYVGGHVECLESGVFRNDIEVSWSLEPSAFQALIDNIDRALCFALEVEEGISREDVTNYDEVRASIVRVLEDLRDRPVRKERPSIYHLDVAAMYPNIILSNRLQPYAMATEETCAACDYNDPANGCQRRMDWIWRGDMYPATAAEVAGIRNQLDQESFDPAQVDPDYKPRAGRFTGAAQGGGRAGGGGGWRQTNVPQRVPYSELSAEAQDTLLRQRLKKYSQRVYKRVKDTVETARKDTVCQREHPFYVDTVRAFRDRRYEYKKATKAAFKKLQQAEKSGDAIAANDAKNENVYYDSLQLAHKCILNSFYGYVMRKGARWRSMPMAGVVTLTGANLITQARELVEQIGRPLELDTDGIWCILPGSFPEDFTFTVRATPENPKPRTVQISYPCIMLNVDVHDRYTNHQYQTRVGGEKGDAILAAEQAHQAAGGARAQAAAGGAPPALELPSRVDFTTKSECSIFFEVDGPYRCMVLPASQEEGKLLKKRYAVFEMDGSLAELKGFELKRRGELKLIKLFQEEVFAKFLDGDGLQECYSAVAAAADKWLDVLATKGVDLPDNELVDLISENRSMSKTLAEYGSQKSTAISTATRLAEFLGAEMVKDKGLACKLVIARKPEGAPVTERAIPTAIFQASDAIRLHFLRRWLKDASAQPRDLELRSVIDWDYYATRLGNAVQKIITIPAALQRVDNPVPRVQHPDWLRRIVRENADSRRQTTLSTFMKPVDKRAREEGSASADDLLGSGGGQLGDLEDMLMRSPGAKAGGRSAPRRVALARSSRRLGYEAGSDSEEEGAGTGAGGGGSRADRLLLHGEEVDEDDQPRQPGADPEDELGGASESAHSRVHLPPLNPEDDFEAWLARRSTQWAELRAERKRGRESKSKRGGAEARAAEAVTLQSAGGGLQGYVRGVAAGVEHGYWQIVELRRSGTPGEFTAWVITETAGLQRLKLMVPRTVLVNRTVAHPVLESRRVQRTLPHGRVARHLYLIRCPEGSFARRQSFLADIRADPCVEEPLASDEVGGVDSGPLELGDLEYLTTTTHPYLHGATGSLRRMFIFHATAGARSDRSVAVVLVLSSTAASEEESLEQQAEAAAVDARDEHIRQWRQELIRTVRERGGAEALRAVTVVGDDDDDDDDDNDLTVAPGTPPRAGAATALDQIDLTGIDLGGFGLRAVLSGSVPSPVRRAADRAGRAAGTAVRAQPAIPGYTVPLKATCHVLVTGRGEDGDARVKVGPVFQEVFQEVMVERADGSSAPGVEVEFNQSTHSSVRSLLSGLGALVDQLRQSRPGPTLVASQSTLDKPDLLRAVPALSEFPVMEMGWVPADELQLSGLRWRRSAIARGLKRALLFLQAYPALLDAARYAHVPVANLGPKLWSSICDVFYARLLAHNRHVLWVSPSRLPDLGGSELRPEVSLALVPRPVPRFDYAGGFTSAKLNHQRGARRSAASADKGADSAANRAASAWNDPAVNPSENRPGCYRRVCVDLELSHLAVATILRAHHIVEGETTAADRREILDAVGATDKAAAAAAATKEGHARQARIGEKGHSRQREEGEEEEVVTAGMLMGVSDSARCRAAFRQLRQLVSNWYHDVQTSHNVLAKQLLQRLWQWLSSPAARLHDPALHAMVRGLMTKAWRQLLATLRRRGATVIHATFTRLVIATPKHDAMSALEWTRSLRAHVTAQPLFEPLSLAVQTTMLAALWVDPCNHAAVELPKTALHQMIADQQAGRPPRLEAHGTPVGAVVKAHWNAAKFLPQTAQDLFRTLITQFLVGPLQRVAMRRLAEAREQAAGGDLQALSAEIAGGTSASSAAAAASTERQMNEIVAELVRGVTSPKLLGAISSGQLHAEEGDWPHPPGAYLQMRNPGLELGKLLTHCLNLDRAAEDASAALHRAVLLSCGVRDFSPEAAFRDPCITYVVSDVVCEACDVCRDIDLCRDIYVRSGAGGEVRWYCPACRAEYDRGSLEAMLVATVEGRLAAYQTQDLYCAKTTEVRVGKLSSVSPRSGRWLPAISASTFRDSLLPMRHLSQFHGMEWLRSAVDWALQ